MIERNGGEPTPRLAKGDHGINGCQRRKGDKAPDPAARRRNLEVEFPRRIDQLGAVPNQVDSKDSMADPMGNRGRKDAKRQRHGRDVGRHRDGKREQSQRKRGADHPSPTPSDTNDRIDSEGEGDDGKGGLLNQISHKMEGGRANQEGQSSRPGPLPQGQEFVPLPPQKGQDHKWNQVPVAVVRVL